MPKNPGHPEEKWFIVLGLFGFPSKSNRTWSVQCRLQFGLNIRRTGFPLSKTLHLRRAWKPCSVATLVQTVMGRRILNDALRAIVNAERRGKATVELQPISTVMSSFLNIMKYRGNLHPSPSSFLFFLKLHSLLFWIFFFLK